MIKQYLSTLLFFLGFSRILPFYPAIIQFKYFPVFLPLFLSFYKNWAHWAFFYMFATFASGKTNLIWIIASTISMVAQLPGFFYETHPSHTIDTYRFQPICPLSMATYTIDEYRGKERITGRNGMRGEDLPSFHYLWRTTSDRPVVLRWKNNNIYIYTGASQ